MLNLSQRHGTTCVTKASKNPQLLLNQTVIRIWFHAEFV